MGRRAGWRFTAGVAALAAALTSGAAAQAVIDGPGLVQEDASLRIGPRVVHLHGIFIPDGGRHCETAVSPPRCGSRAALALDFRVRGFVACTPVATRPDGSLAAVCRVDRTAFAAGEDLAAYLLERGLALATPEAPFAYHALERLARANRRGLWGETPR